jgi:predicted MPP superfamily phosphohydrolase
VKHWKRLSLVLSALAVAGAGWAFWLEPASLSVRISCVPFVTPLRGPLTVALLTDLHVGSPYNGVARLEEIVRRTNAASPDLVMILGDLVIQHVVGGSFVPPEEIASRLAGLKPRFGTFAVLGNHDAWLDAARVAHALSSSGIRVLEDEATKVDADGGPVWIAGVSDYLTARHDVPRALSAIPDHGVPILLITHNPDVFPDVPARVSLTLAGHTHGGQVRFPLIGAPIVPSRFGQRFASGLVMEDNRRLFVATGTGTSIIPVRFRVPPAIDVLKLQRSC